MHRWGSVFVLLTMFLVSHRCLAGEESQELAGMLVDPNGQAMANVTVCLTTRHLDIYDAKFPQDGLTDQQLEDWARKSPDIWLQKTNAQGEFRFLTRPRQYTLLVSTDAGYSIAKSKDFQGKLIELRLTPWVRLEGRVERDAQPASAGMTIDASHDNEHHWMYSGTGPYIHLRTTTDANGRFTFNRVFAGEYRISRAGGKAVVVEASAGKTIQVTVPILGREITGRIVLPKELQNRADVYMGSTTLKKVSRLPHAAIPDNIWALTPPDREAWFKRWVDTPQGQEAKAQLAEARERREVQFSKEGTFQMGDVLPGEYVLPVIFLRRTDHGIDYDNVLATVSYRFKVPDDPAAGAGAPLDVGSIPVDPAGVANAGQEAPDFVYRGINGTDYRFSDLKGKVILLDFWGTWCGVCLGHLPKLKEIHAKHKDDPDFVMLSLSVNDEPAVLEKFLKKHDMSWHHAILGDREQALPVLLYQVSGYPSYWLIGRDGKVLFNDWRIDDLPGAISNALLKP